MKKVVYKFAEKTSLGGFNKLTSSRRQVTIAWMVIIVGVSAISMYHLSSLVSEFFQYNVNTAFHIYRNSFEFPDVTICASSQASAQRYHDQRYKQYRDIRTFGQKFWRHYWYHIVSPADNRTIKRLNETDLNIMMDDQLLRKVFKEAGFRSLDEMLNKHERYWFADFLGPVARRKQDFVIDCVYGVDDCTTNEFKLYDDPYHYNCFTFAPKNRSVVNDQEATGPPKMLKLTLHREDGKRLATTAFEFMSHAIGFYVAIHARNTLPDSGSYILAETGYKTSIFIDMSAQKKIDLPGRHCLVDNHEPINFVSLRKQARGDIEPHIIQYQNDRRGCLARRYQEKLRKKCGCYSAKLPIPYMFLDDIMSSFERNKRMPFCGCVTLQDIDFSSLRGIHIRNGSENQAATFISIFSWKNNSTEQDFVDFIKRNGIDRELICYHENSQADEAIEQRCMQPCFQQKYTPLTINRALYPYTAEKAAQFLPQRVENAIDFANNTHTSVLKALQKAMERNKDNITFYRSLFQQIEIIPMTTDASFLVESRAVTFMELLSNVGGMFGLWSGLCVITVFEVLELIILLILTSIRRGAKNERGSFSNSIQVELHEGLSP